MKTIRIIFTLVAFCFVSGFAFSQSDTIPVYRQFPTVPAFKLMKADSSFFIMKDMVRKKKPTVIIIFSPTCSHCQHQAEEITSHMKELKDMTFIFSTLYPVQDMAQYISSYGLDKFPNIFVGHDKGYMLGSFYKLNSLPGVFVYTKKGNLKAEFGTNITTETLLNALQK